ncbi:MAG: hypothetical protein JWN44_3026 [Myxococcales bacterium]|nr:hypothetical protein [Myxococcales bacterium]
MKKVLVATALFVLVVGTWWLRREHAPELQQRVPTATVTTNPTQQVRWAQAGAAQPTAAAPAEPTLLAKKLELKDDALRSRLDEVIPNRLYGEAAKCYHGGGNRDDRIDLSYRISVADGNVTFSNLQVTDSTLTDRGLERCIKDRILSAKWRDEELPDLDEEDDLFMRVYNLQKYAANDEPATAGR